MSNAEAALNAAINITRGHENLRHTLSVADAFKEWLDNHDNKDVKVPEPELDNGDHQPQGNNFASTERRGESSYSHELNANDRPGPYGRGISLKWGQQ